MKKAILLFTIVFSLLITGCNDNLEVDYQDSINSIIGNESFITKFGVSPQKTTNEDLRIKTHLEYVEQLLRKKDVSNLKKDLKAKRKLMLDLLHEYHSANKYPRNYDFDNERKPCFIDKHGNICAVGYLVEQTAGRKLAEKINEQYQYSKITEMKQPELNRWIDNSGLSLREIAMIQPNYSKPKPDSYVSPIYGISSSILSGTTLSLMALNVAEMSRASQSKKAPIWGIIAGSGQFALGIAKFPKEVTTMNGAITNESQKHVSLLNIGLGTSSILIGTYNLLSNKEARKNKSTAWQFYSYPLQTNSLAIGLSVRKQF